MGKAPFIGTDISLGCIPVDPQLSLVQIMAWCQLGNKPLPELMMTKVLWRHIAIPDCPKLTFLVQQPIFFTSSLPDDDLVKYGSRASAGIAFPYFTLNYSKLRLWGGRTRWSTSASDIAHLSWYPCIVSLTGMDCASTSSNEHDSRSNGRSPDDYQVPHMEQWLALRVHGGARQWPRLPSCFTTSQPWRALGSFCCKNS